MTVDPARRLADALGQVKLGSEPVRHPDEPRLVGRHARRHRLVARHRRAPCQRPMRRQAPRQRVLHGGDRPLPRQPVLRRRRGDGYLPRGEGLGSGRGGHSPIRRRDRVLHRTRPDGRPDRWAAPPMVHRRRLPRATSLLRPRRPTGASGRRQRARIQPPGTCGPVPHGPDEPPTTGCHAVPRRSSAPETERDGGGHHLRSRPRCARRSASSSNSPMWQDAPRRSCSTAPSPRAGPMPTRIAGSADRARREPGALGRRGAPSGRCPARVRLPVPDHPLNGALAAIGRRRISMPSRTLIESADGLPLTDLGVG